MQAKEQHFKFGKNIKELLFGWNDGVVSTIALVAGLTGAVIQNNIIILATVAEIFAGSISMSLGTYISSKSQIELYENELEREKREMKELPEVERQEIRDIYRKKGFKGKELEMIVKRITSNKKMWLDIMMKEELGFVQESFDDPVKNAWHMFIAYVSGGIIPLLPYLFLDVSKALTVSITLAAILLFSIGAVKTYLTGKHWLKSAIESLAIGMLAAFGAYLIGKLISGYFLI